MLNIERTDSVLAGGKFGGSEYRLSLPGDIHNGFHLGTNSQEAIQGLEALNERRRRTNLPELIPENRYSCAFRPCCQLGDWISTEVDGFEIVATIVADDESNPDEFDDDDNNDLRESFARGEWRYVGVQVEVSKGGVALGDASLWGIECGLPGREYECARYLTHVGNELLPEAISEAREVVDIVKSNNDDFRAFWRGYRLGIAFTSTTTGIDGSSPETLPAWRNPGGDIAEVVNVRDVSRILRQVEKYDQLHDDCLAFYEVAVDRGLLFTGDDFERAGVDFHLTRNRHGSGFWDGQWEDLLRQRGKPLAELAHPYGSAELMFRLLPGHDPESEDLDDFEFELAE
jgi:hypothetical protein